ncbi:MAG: hypothetical protein AB7V39_00555 [Nitrospiraceae bacterium]
MEMNQNSSEAPLDQSATSDGVQPPNETTAPAASSEVSRPTNDAPTAPAKEGDQSGQSGKNWEQEYLKLRTTLGLEKDGDIESYKALRIKLQQQGTEKNSYAKKMESMESQLKQLAEAFTKATEAPYDPDQFMGNLRTQGPKFLEQALKNTFEAREAKILEQLNETRVLARSMQVEREFEKRVADPKNYPDFKKLEPTMTEIYNKALEAFDNGSSPTDPRAMDPRELFDQLFNLARYQHTDQALKEAEAHGKAKAEAELANESMTTVAAGGKGASKPVFDPNTLSVEKHREWLIAQGLGRDL